MATQVPSILRLTDWALYEESAVGTKTGDSWQLRGVESIGVQVRTHKSVTTKDAIRNTKIDRPLQQSYKVTLAGEFDNNPGWKLILESLWGDAISASVATPSAGYTESTYCNRRDLTVGLFGMTAELPGGDAYQFKGMAVEGISISVDTQAIVSFQLDFGCLQIEGGATHTAADNTYDFAPFTHLDASVDMVLGDPASLAGSAADALDPCTGARVFMTRAIRPVQFGSTLLGVAEGTAWATGATLDITGTIEGIPATADKETLVTGTTKGIVRLALNEGGTTEWTLTMPRANLKGKNLPVAVDDWDMIRVDAAGVATETGGDGRTGTLVSVYPA